MDQDFNDAKDADLRESNTKFRSAMRHVAQLALALGATALAMAVGFGLLRWAGVDLFARVQAGAQRPGVRPGIGIYQPDPVLGWSHVPGSVGHHRLFGDFDVTYSIDSRGHRRIPGYAEEEGDPRPAILFLGGSFTFGHGVEDDETFPALLADTLLDYRIINAATSGWGTTQAKLVLDRRLGLDDRIAAVVYGYIEHHDQRNAGRRAWLEYLRDNGNRRAPHVELTNGVLRFSGLADVERNGLEPGQALLIRESEVTRLLLEAMAAACASRRVPFVLVHLPDGSSPTAQPSGSAASAELVGASFRIDLRNQIRHADFVLGDGAHPNAEGHAEIARVLSPLLYGIVTGSASPEAERGRGGNRASAGR